MSLNSPPEKNGMVKCDHDRALRMVMEDTYEKSIKFNPDKVKFKVSEVVYVRHVISTAGLNSDEWVISKFNGTSTPKGSYSAKTGAEPPYESKQSPQEKNVRWGESQCH